MRLKLLTVLAGALLMTVSAFAGPVNFCPTGSYGPTNEGLAVTSGGITATGWSGTSTTTANTQVDLSCKDQGSAEFGLGIFGATDGEIDSSHFVQLDLMGLNINTLTIESIQSGEGFNILGSATSGVLGTVSLASGTGSGGVTQTVTIDTAGVNFVDITATGGNVLLNSFSATPEPGTYLMMGTGLLMLGFFMRRKLAASSL